MARMNQRQMETLSDRLVSSRPKSSTVGKIVPVPRMTNPYSRNTPTGARSNIGPGLQAALAGNSTFGANAFAQNRPAISTDIDVSYEADPTLARIKALGQQSVGNARTEAAALRKQAIIDTGLADVGGEIGLDAGTLQAARENPFSYAARIRRESQERGRQLDESLNQQNLFYSGHRANQLGELARDTADEETELLRDLRAALGGIDSGVLSAEQTALAEETRAAEAAAEAARQAALQQAFLDALAAPLAPADPVTGGGTNPDFVVNPEVAPPAPVVWNDQVLSPAPEVLGPAPMPNEDLLTQLAVAQAPYSPPPISMYYAPENPYVPIPDPVYEPDFAYSNAVNLIQGAPHRYF